jgi:hypothetical protein
MLPQMKGKNKLEEKINHANINNKLKYKKSKK